MITTTLKCKQCKGPLEYEEGSSILHCPQCGYTELIEESELLKLERIRAKNQKDIEVEKARIENDAYLEKKRLNVEQARVEEQEKTERARIAVEEKKRNDSHVLVYLLIMLLIPIFFYLFNGYLHINDPPKVAVSFAAKDFVGMNYQEVRSILRKDGFTDISLKKEEDVVFGVMVKEGEVKKVTIDGSAKFKSGDKFDADAKIVIIYHTRK